MGWLRFLQPASNPRPVLWRALICTVKKSSTGMNLWGCNVGVPVSFFCTCGRISWHITKQCSYRDDSNKRHSKRQTRFKILSNSLDCANINFNIFTRVVKTSLKSRYKKNCLILKHHYPCRKCGMLSAEHYCMYVLCYAPPFPTHWTHRKLTNTLWILNKLDTTVLLESNNHV